MMIRFGSVLTVVDRFQSSLTSKLEREPQFLDQLGIALSLLQHRIDQDGLLGYNVRQQV